MFVKRILALHCRYIIRDIWGTYNLTDRFGGGDQQNIIFYTWEIAEMVPSLVSCDKTWH